MHTEKSLSWSSYCQSMQPFEPRKIMCWKRGLQPTLFVRQQGDRAAPQRTPEAISREQRRRRRNRLRSAAIDDAAESEDEASDEDYDSRLDATVEELARNIARLAQPSLVCHFLC